MLVEFIIFIIVLYLVNVNYSEKRPPNYPPGPTGIPILGYLPFLVPDSHVKIGKLGKKYGKIFSMKLGNFWFVVLNDVEVIKNALKMEEFTGRPNHLLGMVLVKKGIAYNDGNDWVEQRRFALKTLRDFGFGKKSMESSVQEEVQDLITHFRGVVGKPVALKEVIGISMLNALWTLVAGEKFSLDDPYPKRIYNISKQGFMEPEIQGPLYFLPWMAKVAPDYTGFTTIKKATNEIQELLLGIIEEHKKTFSPDTLRDYIDVYISKTIEVGDDKTSSFYGENGVQNFVDSLINLFVAGSDTLSSSLGFAIQYLTSYPKILHKMQEEIDEVVGRSRLPSTSDRPKLPYIEAVIAEVFRYSSIVAGCVLHKVTEDVNFMGYFLPKGTIIMPNLYQVHHNEEYWKDPENFRPERFLNDDGSFRKDDSLIPFSTGKRVCPAENLASVEFYLFLTGLVQNFDFKEHKDYPLPPFIPKSSFVLAPTPYKIVIEERN